MRRRIARASGLVAVLFGLVVGFNLLTGGGAEGWALVLVSGSVVLSLGGGAAFLYGLERGPRWVRIGGWIAYSLGLLLPTGLFILQWLAIAGGLVALARDTKRLAHEK